ncbi:MAG: hypothetical protein QG671_645 [Actinomycetota bacterium]|nr:hypothetical protein [Actinomycetota bacterium]
MEGSAAIRPPVPPAARALLRRSATDLIHGCAALSPGERYAAAHLAALRAAAAVLVVRRPPGKGGPRSVWETLPRVAPEMAGWAAYFTSTAVLRAAVEAGRGEAIRAQDADGLLRDAGTFHHAVEAFLGLPFQRILPDVLPVCG